MLAAIVALDPGTSVAQVPAAVPAPAYETPQLWPAAKFLPGAELAGEGWEIEPTVSNDGIYNTWGVSSEVGPYQITGDERLFELLVEIEATIRLQEISKGREFARGLGDAGKAQWDAVMGVATAPVETVKKLPEGASRFLGRIGNTVKHTVQGTLDIDTNATPAETAREIFGVEKAKRLIAADLGVNPFSHNPALQRALNQVATVRALGKLTVDIGSMVVIPVTIGHVLTGTNIASTLTKEQIAADPKELAEANKTRALAAGIPASSIDALNRNVCYNPWSLTSLWNCLAAMGSVKTTVFVDMAAGASSDLDAFYFVRVAQIMAFLQSRGAGIQELVPLTHTVACVQKDGSLLVPLWFDYAIWTPDAFASATELQTLAKSRNAPSATIITTGKFSAIAADRLSAMGLRTIPSVMLPNSP